MHSSRLVLGTVQLGMEYGVNNEHGAPSTDEAFAILDAAFASGINTFDTAASYGEAENILGEWISTRGLENEVLVTTKIKSEDTEGVPAEIQRSLRRLRIEGLDGCLLHVPESMEREGVMKGLREAQKTGLTAHIGVSVYEEESALRAIELGMQYVQVPYNALDQRLDQGDFFAAAKEKGVTVFARSPLLQGLLLMEPERLPPHLAHARPFLERFVEIAKRHGLTRLEAAFGFAYAHCRADHIVFGVETLTQLEEILDAVKRVATDGALWIQEMEEAFAHMDPAVVDPRVWNKK